MGSISSLSLADADAGVFVESFLGSDVGGEDESVLGNSRTSVDTR